MGNSASNFSKIFTPKNISIGGGIILLIILGFIIYKYVFKDKEEDNNDKSNYEDDRRCVNKKRGLAQGMIN